MNYKQLVKDVPSQESTEFITYLRDNNRVVFETEHFLGIMNAKRVGWVTAFWKHPEDKRNSSTFDTALMQILNQYPSWEWRKHQVQRQSVPNRFHIHLIPPGVPL